MMVKDERILRNCKVSGMHGTSGPNQFPYNGWRPYNGCWGTSRRGRGTEKGESMGIEEMLKKGDGVRRTPGISRKDFLRLSGTGLAGAALLGTAGCGVFSSGGSGGGGGGGGGGSSITLNLQSTIRDMDSTTTTDSVSAGILLNVMEGLYRLDESTGAPAGDGGGASRSATTGSPTRSRSGTACSGLTGTR